MTKTLADMTAEERAECVGMWCSIAGAGRLCVLLSTETGVANLGFSCDNEFTILSLRYKNVTPRFDLPRAWMPDGEPELAQALAEETYEYIAEWCDHGVWAPIEMEMFDGTFPNLQAARGYIKVAKTRGPYEDTRIVRRRVSPPEVINE